MAKKYTQIGSMQARTDKDTKKPLLDKNDKQLYTIKLDKEVELTVNGEKVTSGYLNIARPRDKFDRMLAKGTITEKEHAEKIKRFEKGGDLAFIQFEISATTEE